MWKADRKLSMLSGQKLQNIYGLNGTSNHFAIFASAFQDVIVMLGPVGQAITMVNKGHTVVCVDRLDEG